MIYSPPHFNDPFHPSVYDGITGWAAHTRVRWLVALTIAGIGVGTALVVTDWRRAPLAGLLLVASAIGAWGLLEQRTATPHSRGVRVAQSLLVLLGTLGAIVGGFTVLFWVMGPAPVL
jgi:hypothetical protein